jgi:hypothetical protein
MCAEGTPTPGSSVEGTGLCKLAGWSSARSSCVGEALRKKKCGLNVLYISGELIWRCTCQSLPQSFQVML